MPKPREQKPITVRCPHCGTVGEPEFNETTGHHVCAICATPLDAQVFIEKRKRGLK